jgi:hypothetical protein
MYVVVGNVPMSPVMVVAPVLVIPEPARTAKLSAVPRVIGLTAACDPPASESISPIALKPTAATAVKARRCFLLLIWTFFGNDIFSPYIIEYCSAVSDGSFI